MSAAKLQAPALKGIGHSFRASLSFLGLDIPPQGRFNAKSLLGLKVIMGASGKPQSFIEIFTKSQGQGLKYSASNSGKK